VSEKIKTPYVTIWVEDGIVFHVFGPVEVDLEVAKHAIQTRIEFTGGKTLAAVADMRAIKGMTQEAREYFATEGLRYLTARAIITGNVQTRTVAEVFVMINRPSIPTKIFSDYAEAKEWLQPYAGTD
jgi:hypothetical protein